MEPTPTFPIGLVSPPLHKLATEAPFIDEGPSLEILQLLVEYGADINATTTSGETPLVLACRAGKLRTALAMIMAGAKLTSEADLEALIALLKKKATVSEEKPTS